VYRKGRRTVLGATKLVGVAAFSSFEMSQYHLQIHDGKKSAEKKRQVPPPTQGAMTSARQARRSELVIV
jgi:hypothetical protein